MPSHTGSVGSRLLLSAGVIALMTNVAQAQSDKEPMANSKAESAVEQSTFGQLPDGREVQSYQLTNANGVELQVINYGGTIVSLKVPDVDGNIDDIALGFESLEGETYSLATNDGDNHLHGGEQGFDRVLWQAEPLKMIKGRGWC